MIVTKITLSDDKTSLPFLPPEEFTAIRREHWINSRKALAACLKDLRGTDLNHSSEFSIQNHHHLKAFPEILVSISHTRGAGAACTVQKSSKYLGVGIDIEFVDRVIKVGAKEKFLNPTDQGETDLHLWTGKEACFKAASFFWNREKTFILKDIQLSGENFEIDSLLRGKCEFNIEGDYLCAIAWVEEVF